MVKKLLQPIYVGVFILVLLLGSLAHLMYGSCQTTKYHYICQAYWMPDYLPKNLWRENFISDPSGHLRMLTVDDDFTGKWLTWWRNGSLSYSISYMNGRKEGEFKRYYNDGSKETIMNYSNGRLNGKWVSWHKNGKVSGISEYKDNEEVSVKSWNEDGSIEKVAIPIEWLEKND